MCSLNNFRLIERELYMLRPAGWQRNFSWHAKLLYHYNDTIRVLQRAKWWVMGFYDRFIRRREDSGENGVIHPFQDECSDEEEM